MRYQMITIAIWKFVPHFAK